MKNARKILKEFRGTIVFLLLIVVFRSAVADWYEVPTGSMKPTIIEGDRVFVNKLAYGLRIPLTSVLVARWDEPRRGDIVVFNSHAADKRLIKRVAGIPGDTVAIRANRLIINGTVASYALPTEPPPSDIWQDAWRAPVVMDEIILGARHPVAMFDARSDFGPLTVPADHYFMLGDNRDNSADSRSIGFVPRREIVGQAKAVVLSLDSDHYYLPRAQRFFEHLP